MYKCRYWRACGGEFAHFGDLKRHFKEQHRVEYALIQKDLLDLEQSRLDEVDQLINDSR